MLPDVKNEMIHHNQPRYSSSFSHNACHLSGDEEKKSCNNKITTASPFHQIAQKQPQKCPQFVVVGSFESELRGNNNILKRRLSSSAFSIDRLQRRDDERSNVFSPLSLRRTLTIDNINNNHNLYCYNLNQGFLNSKNVLQSKGIYIIAMYIYFLIFFYYLIIIYIKLYIFVNLRLL